MDTTVRNLDEQAYRALRARAVLEGRTVGELISEAIRAYLGRGAVKRGTASLRAPTGAVPGGKRTTQLRD